MDENILSLLMHGYPSDFHNLRIHVQQSVKLLFEEVFLLWFQILVESDLLIRSLSSLEIPMLFKT
jgi:hypothetical protein